VFFLFNIIDMDFTPKTLPSNLEAEQAVLAAIMLNNRSLEKISDFLKAEDFSHPAHREIYKEALRFYEGSQNFDIISAKSYLEQQGTLDSVGGIDYLTQLASAGATVVNIEQYARIIHENAMRRKLIELGQTITDSAFIEDPDNPVSHQIESAEQQLFNMAETGDAKHETISISTALKSALEEVAIAYKADGKLSGLTTGFTDLDRALSGLHKSNLIILAGRPAMGKTAFALNLALNAASAIYSGRANEQYKGAVIFFSLEMGASELAARVLSSQSRIPGTEMRSGSLSDEDYLKLTQYSDALSSLPLCIDDTAGMSLPMIRSRARRIARTHGGVALIVIDYLQLITSPGGKNKDNRVQELSEITRGLKILSKDLNVPVIALSQLSRGVENRDDKRPQLADLRDSGSIEQDADIVMFTYRESYYLQNRDPRGKVNGKPADPKDIERWQNAMKAAQNKADIIVGKNRHGPTATVHLNFFSEYGLFESIETIPEVAPFQDNTPSVSTPFEEEEPQNIDADALQDMDL